MTESGRRLLDLLFEPGEEVCVSPDKYGYCSVPLEEVGMGSLVLSPNNPEKQLPRYCSPSDLQLVAINPIKGVRCDQNVTAFRSFMVEMDKGSLSEQFFYINSMGMPYSACVFSGSKSLHFALTLTKALPSEEIWRFYMQWILNVMAEADQQAKNPSRSIRFAGNVRKNTGNEMKFLQCRGRLDVEELQAWLSHYKSFRPTVQEKRPVVETSMDVSMLPSWVQNALFQGFDPSKGRNNTWFSIALQCGLLGWDEDDTISFLEHFFQEERDFSRREWEGAIRSGVRKARNKVL